MPPRGRKPVPTKLKVLRNNPGKRALNENEPEIEPSLPAPPEFLTDEARAEWTRIAEGLYRSGILARIDRAALAAYCQAYGRWERAEKALAEMSKRDELTGGLMIRTTNGNAVQNPLVGTANKAMADMMRYAAEFGMTPSARSRIKAEAREDENPFKRFRRRA